MKGWLSLLDFSRIHLLWPLIRCPILLVKLYEILVFLFIILHNGWLLWKCLTISSGKS